METLALHFEELGNADNPPLVILHGFFASSRNWRQIAGQLATHFHVYILDARNHGQSPHHELMNYETMVADVLRFIDTQQLPRVSLLGHSMGGKCAMWFALNHADRVDKLIVADIAPVSYDHSFSDFISALQDLPLNEISNRKQAELLLATAIPDLSYRQFLLQNLLLVNEHYQWRVNLNIFAQNAANIIAFPDTARCQAFSKTTLFLAGEQSTLVRREAIQSLFPTATIEVIANAGHWLHVQQPTAFLASVARCLLVD